jgi:tetraacyldisaccharide 4'-kinase
VKPQPWLAPLTPFYAAAVRARNAAYNSRLLQQKKLSAPVVSIGNLSAGGGGKTPFVLALARLLDDAGIAVDILSRGYGRSSDAVEMVDPGPQSTAERYGDEPLLMARAVPVPVYVGSSRFAAGLLAETPSGNSAAIHLLDDGFQHRRLARDIDIVLLRREDFRARLLPAGPMREPLSSLRRTHVVVLRDEDRGLEGELGRYLDPDANVWHVRRQMFVKSEPGPAVAFCGIAHPEEFFSGLRKLGVEIAASIAFQDHHRFSETDIAKLCAQASLSAAVRFLTTEKDLVRLSPEALTQLQNTALVECARLQATIVEADTVIEAMHRLL